MEKSITEQIVELTPEERAELERKESRNQYIAVGFGLVTTVAAAILERTMTKKLRKEFVLKTIDEQKQEDN